MIINILSPNINITVNNFNIGHGLKINRNHRIAKEKKDKQYYGNSLSIDRMENIYKNCHFSDISIGPYKIPYTIEILFFKIDNKPFTEYSSLKCRYNINDNIFLLQQDHPLSDETLLNKLNEAYTNRRWDNKTNWGRKNGIIYSQINRKLMRISDINVRDNLITYALTDYDTNAVTHLVIDMEVNNKTLRQLTFDSINQILPKLSDIRLPNNLSIAILFLDDEGFPIFPLRSDKVAIFCKEWGSTVSFAVGFPSSTEEDLFINLIKPKIIEHIYKETNINAASMNFIPLALTREWFRGGKPTLFFAVETYLKKEQIEKCILVAEHTDEYENYRKIIGLFKKHKKIWLDSEEDLEYIISDEALQNYILYKLYKSMHNNKNQEINELL